MNQNKTQHKVFVVIPAFNEENNISSVIDGAKKYTENIVVIDDGSTDRTFEIAEKKVIALRHIVNMGKGAALKTGCDYAISKKCDILVVMDGDNQHDPKYIPELLKALDKGDLIIGSRPMNKSMPPIPKLGNIFIQYITKILYDVGVTDTQSGFRAFKQSIYRKIRWVSTSYSMESEMIANASKAGLKIIEVPIKTIYLDNHKGTTVIDGIKIVLDMIRWRLVR